MNLDRRSTDQRRRNTDKLRRSTDQISIIIENTPPPSPSDVMCGFIVFIIILFGIFYGFSSLYDAAFDKENVDCEIKEIHTRIDTVETKIETVLATKQKTHTIKYYFNNSPSKDELSVYERLVARNDLEKRQLEKQRFEAFIIDGILYMIKYTCTGNDLSEYEKEQIEEKLRNGTTSGSIERRLLWNRVE